MAGAGESGLVDSVLETPTYVLSIVFMMFLAVSGAFEVTHHFAHRMLVKRGRLGIANALDKLVMELTLLGFVSLILTAFSSPLSHMCVNYDQSMGQWTMESSINGCPCCMADTGGLSFCSLIQHDCTWNVTDRKPFCECNITGSEAYYTAPNASAQEALVSDDCLAFDRNEVTFFVESSINTLASLSVYANASVPDICDSINQELDLAQQRQELGLAAQLEAAGIDPEEGIILPWDETSGFRRRLTEQFNSSGGQQQRLRRLHSSNGAAAARHHQAEMEQPTAVAGPQRQGPQHLGRRLLGGGGDMGDRVTDPLNVLVATRSNDPFNPTDVHVLPRAKLFKCTGPFLSSSCPNGKVPAISANALHQVHIWLFLIAITHVATCVVQFLVATARILLWRRWERLARQEAMPRSTAALAASTVVSAEQKAAALDAAEQAAEKPPPAQPPSLKGSCKLEETAPANGAAAAAEAANGHAAAAHGQAAAAAAQAAATAAGQEEQVAAGGPASVAPSAAESVEAGGRSQAAKSGGGSGPRLRSVQKLRSTARFVWKFKPADIHEWGVTGWLMEAAICLVQALWPNLVTRGNFILLRKAWLAAGAQTMRRLDSAPSCTNNMSGPETGQADFVGHVLECLEGDLATFVGLSVEMGVCIVVVVLLMGVTGNIGGVTLVYMACSLMLLTNMALVALLRHQCRGARPNRSRSQGQWWRTPHFVLAIPLRLLNFLCSFVFSSTAFFAWQFGSTSCFFTSEWGLWSIWNLTWWSGLVVAAVILVWSSAATIPAYALAAHSRHRTLGNGALLAGGHHSASHSHHSKQRELMSVSAGPKENGSGEGAGLPPAGESRVVEASLQAEVERLQAQVAELEAHVAQLHARLAAHTPAEARMDAAALQKAA